MPSRDALTEGKPRIMKPDSPLIVKRSLLAHSMRFLGISFALIGLASPDAMLAAGVSFDELVAHPERFNGKRISAVGIAEDGGDRICLYRDIDVRRRIDLKRAFLAYIPRQFPNYPST